MKKCTYCGKELFDQAVICPGCGCPAPKVCKHCGKEIANEAVICMNCGCPVEPQVSQSAGQPFTQSQAAYAQPHYSQPTYTKPAPRVEELVNILSQRLFTNGVIWLVIGAVQIILGLLWQWFLLIVGVLNVISSIQDITKSKQLPDLPQGMLADIPAEYEPLTGPIITLIYNLFVGGVIGVAGSIYYLVAVRGFVMENQAHFEALNVHKPISEDE